MPICGSETELHQDSRDICHVFLHGKSAPKTHQWMNGDDGFKIVCHVWLKGLCCQQQMLAGVHFIVLVVSMHCTQLLWCQLVNLEGATRTLLGFRTDTTCFIAWKEGCWLLNNKQHIIKYEFIGCHMHTYLYIYIYISILIHFSRSVLARSIAIYMFSLRFWCPKRWSLLLAIASSDRVLPKYTLYNCIVSILVCILGGGFKYVLFSPLLAEMIQFD